MPPVIVGIAAGIAAAGVVSTAAAIAIGIGAAALTYAATPKFDGGSFANEAFTQQQMLRSPVEPRRGIYGRAMVSGPLVFAEETGADNAYLHLVIPLAGHRCDGVEKIYFGDDVAWANGALTSKYASVARLKVHLGNQTTSDPDLTAECRQWTSAHVGFGVTYLYARLKFDTKVFPNGVPNIKALVRGKQVYDPRKNTHNWEEPTTWEWSDNWALCCLDYNRFESGVGAAAHEIDVSYFAAAANDSDQLVEYKTGKFEKRYTCNGTYNQDVSPSSIMEKMLTAGAGMHVYVSGQYRLYAGVYQGPEVLVLTEDDAAGDIDVRPYTPRAELCNAVRGTFVDPENFYQPTDFPPYESSYYRAHDDGEYIDHDLDLPFTQSVWTAQRLGKLYLEQKRAGMQISMPVKMIGVAVSVGKVVGLSLPRLGIDGTFQIVDWQFDYGKPVSLILIETSAELFDYAMGSYTERDLTPNVILPNPATVPTPIGLQYVEYQDDPQWQGQLTWSAPANNSSYRYVIEVSNGLGEVVYQTNADATRSMLPKLDTGFYTVSLWALNLFANRSNVPATLTIGATLPAPVIGIAVIAGPLTLTLRPTTAAQIAQTTQFEILGSITNNIAEAALIGTGKDAVWPDRHPNTRYHVWARTINNYGVSSWYGPVEATTSADNTSIIDLIGNTFKNYTWFAWADDASGTGFTTVEAIGDGKAYMGIAPDKPTASPSGNWQDYTWSKIKADIGPVFTPEEEAKLDNLMAGKLPNAPDKDMLAAQDALNNPALANNLITALSLLNQGINAPALGGETPASAQAKADAAQNAAINAAAASAANLANNARAQAEANAALNALNQANTAKNDAIAIASNDASAKVSAIKIGGTNLVDSSLINIDSNVYGFGGRSVNLIAGREYTFSLAGSCSQLALNEGHHLVAFIFYPSWSFSSSISINSLTESVSSVSFTAPYTGTYYLSSYCFPSDGVRTGTVRCSWYKIEEGNKPSAWSPSPNDFFSDSSVKANDARLLAVGDIASGNFSAQNALISSLLANSGLFNQLKAQLGMFGGLTAETIAASAIATNHLQAGAVTADKVTADTALIQKLIANVGLFNQLQAQLGTFGGLAANSIAAKAITASKLMVTGGGTINYDPMLLDVDAWAVSDGAISFLELSDAPSGKRVLRSNINAYANDKTYYPIDTSKTYRFRFWARSAPGTNGLLYFCLRQFSSAGVGCVYNGGRSPYKPGGESVPTTWTEYSSQWSAADWQPGVKFVQLDWLLNYWGSSGYIEICHPRFEEMASSELIVDGAITTQKILSKAITTDKIAANAVTATELLADTALINKLVATSALFDSLVARLAVFGGLTANSIASDAILGRHIKAGEKITSPIIEGGEVRLIGTAFMKVQSATPFGPDGLVEWYGPKILVNGTPDWANIRKSNAITYLAANGDAYFGGSLSAGVLKTGVTNTDKNPYAANSYPVSIGPFGSNGKAKTVVVSFALSAYSQSSSNPNNPTQPQLSWQLQRKIGSGNWATVSSGVFNGTTSADFEAEPPAHWMVRETCWGSFTFTDNTNSTSDFNYRVLVISYSRYHATSNINTHNLSLISTEQ